MRLSRKAIVAVGAAGVVAGSGAVAMAATSQSSDPSARAAQHAREHDRDRPDADTRAVIESIRKAVLAKAPSIVQPILDQAVADKKLTQAQADSAKQALADLQAGKRPSPDALALLRDESARAVIRDAASAVAKQAPAIAAPIISQAVTDKKLTQAEADRLTAHIAALAQGGGPWAGRGRGGWGGRPGGRFDADTRAVLQDVAAALLKQAPSVAAPILDQAVKDNTITQAQAETLTQAIADVAAKGPSTLGDHRDLLRDDGVRTVVGRIARALSEKAASLGGPIIDQAVKDGKLTQAEGDALKQRLADGFLRGGPGPGPGGGPRGWHGHGGWHGPGQRGG